MLANPLLIALGLSVSLSPQLYPPEVLCPLPVATMLAKPADTSGGGDSEWQELPDDATIEYFGYRGSLETAAGPLEQAEDFAGAEAVWRKGVNTAESNDALEAHEGLVDFLLRRKRPGAAIAVYCDLLKTESAKAGNERVTMIIRTRIARIHFQSGNPRQGNQILDETITQVNQVAAQDLMGLTEVITTFENAGRYAEAEVWRRKSLEWFWQFAKTAPLAANTSAWGVDIMEAELTRNLLLQKKNAPEMLPNIRRLVAEWRARRENDFGQPNEVITESVSRLEGRELLKTLVAADWLATEAAAGSGAIDLKAEAFVAVQEMMRDEATQALTLAAARSAAQNEAGLGNLARRRQELADRWLSLFNARSQLLASGGAGLSTGLADLSRQQVENEAAIKSTDRTMATKFPKFFSMIRPKSLSIEDAKALLAEDEAVLLIEPSRFGTAVIAITREDVVWKIADLSERRITAMVSQVRQDLDPTTSGTSSGPPGFDIATSHALYAELIAPMNAVIGPKTHVFIAAGGALSSLPFGVLVTRPQKPDEDGTDPLTLQTLPWFADAHAIIQIPSLQALDFLRTYFPQGAHDSGKSSGKDFIGYGNPLLDGNAAERGGRGGELAARDASFLVSKDLNKFGAPLMDVERLRKLNQLPGTMIELESIRDTLGAANSLLRLQGEMTERAFKADSDTGRLSRSRILVIATHGLTAVQSGARAEPGLVFTPPQQASEEDDGYLGASDVVGIKLSGTEWVILSACNSATPSGNANTAGLSGLVRAFFFAGAANLLVSHWPVYDSVAAELTASTLAFRARQPGLSRAQALQAAMHDIRAQPQFAHPSAWAPFSLIGDR